MLSHACFYEMFRFMTVNQDNSQSERSAPPCVIVSKISVNRLHEALRKGPSGFLKISLVSDEPLSKWPSSQREAAESAFTNC